MAIKSQKNNTIVIYDFSMNQHNSGKAYHVENPSRMTTIIQRLTMFQKSKNACDGFNFNMIEKTDPCNDDVLLYCHSQNYIDSVEQSWPEDIDPNIEMLWGDIEKFTYFNQYTPLCARKAVNACCTAIDKVFLKEYENAFAIVRRKLIYNSIQYFMNKLHVKIYKAPGHHAGDSNAPTMYGYCVYNNAGIAARYAQQRYKAKKVLIFDWDVHHGNGTQSIFYDDDSVLYISIHRFDNGYFFPTTKTLGNAESTGTGKGNGFNINIGWDCRIKHRLPVGDNEYIYAFESIIYPVVNEYNPDLIIISAGFDALKGDPLGELDMSAHGYCYMLQRLLQIQKQLVCILEGGYNTEQMSIAVQEVVRTLCEGLNTDKMIELKQNALPNEIGLNAVKESIKFIHPFWKNFSSLEYKEYQKNITNRISQNLYGFVASGFTSKFVTEPINNNKKIWELEYLIKRTNTREIAFYSEIYDESSESYKENAFYRENATKFKGVFIDTICQFQDNLIEISEDCINPMPKTDEDQFIYIENLCQNLPRCSIIDFGLGNLNNDNQPIQENNCEFECQINGYIIKSKEGNIIDKNNNCLNISNEKELIILFEKLLMSNESNCINFEALHYFITFCQQFLNYLQKDNRMILSDASILFLVQNNSDSKDQNFVTKINDFKGVTISQQQHLNREVGCINKIKNLINALSIICNCNK